MDKERLIASLGRLLAAGKITQEKYDVLIAGLMADGNTAE